MGSVRTDHRDRTVALARPYRDERDWWAIRALLVETHPRAAPGWAWDVRRWDGWRFHRDQPAGDEELAASIGLWKTPDGRLVGAVHPDGPGEAVLELDPDFRSIEGPMVGWAEDHLAAPAGDGVGRALSWSVLDDDVARVQLLRDLGYEREVSGGWLHGLSFGDVPPQPALPSASSTVTEPYRMRTTEPSDGDCARVAELLNAAFGSTIHTAREYRTFIERSPSFEHELNLVAVAPDGSFAAHVGLTYDATNRHAIAEPVCTHPDHRRAGLARALLLEGLRRVHARGALTAQVDTAERVAANALYVACGFTDARRLHAWRREL